MRLCGWRLASAETVDGREGIYVHTDSGFSVLIAVELKGAHN